MPNLEVQAPNIGVHIPILGVPAPNLGVPGTDVAISAPNTAVQAPGLRVPAPNQAPRLRFPDLWIQSRGAGSPISGCGSWLWGGGVSTRFAGCSGGSFGADRRTLPALRAHYQLQCAVGLVDVA